MAHLRQVEQILGKNYTPQIHSYIGKDKNIREREMRGSDKFYDRNLEREERKMTEMRYMKNRV